MVFYDFKKTERFFLPMRKLDRSVSDVRCEIGGIGALPLREEPLSVPLPELSTVKCAPWCRLKPTVQAHKVYCWWHALGPTSTLGMQAVVPGVPQALC